MEQQKQRVIEICTAWDLYNNTTEEKQILKFYTELGEYADAVLRDDRDAIIDAIGDMAVCLINAKKMQEFEHPYSTVCMHDSFCEFIVEVSCGKYDDALFTIETISRRHGTTLEHCLDTVIKVIEKRKGKMINGVFVKE